MSFRLDIYRFNLVTIYEVTFLACHFGFRVSLNITAFLLRIVMTNFKQFYDILANK